MFNLIMESILKSTDSCHNRVSADQYHMNVSQAQVRTYRGHEKNEIKLVPWSITGNK